MDLILPIRYKLQNLSTYFMTWFFPKGRGKDFWKVYVYFRWIDDIVDDPKISKVYKNKFIKKEYALLDEIYNNTVHYIGLVYEEKGIYDVITKYKDDRKAKELRKHIYGLMSTFVYDINRVGKHIKLREFMEYSKKIGSSYAFAFTFFNPINVKPKASDTKASIGEFGHYIHLAHIVRDYEKDKHIGYINFPREYKNFEEFKKFLRKYVNLGSYQYAKRNKVHLKVKDWILRRIFLRYFLRMKEFEE